MSNRRQKLGRWGESVAADYLEEQGYRIVERNWRTARGEIDLVAQAGDLLLFVEVKTRRGQEAGTPEEALTRRKARKLFSLAQAYLYQRRLEDVEWRIDLVAVEVDSAGELLRCEHVPNAVPTW